MNAENPVQIDLFGVFATGTKDTRLAEHIGGSCARAVDQRWSRSVTCSLARAAPDRRLGVGGQAGPLGEMFA